MNNLCSTCCVCLWEPPGRWLQRAGVRGPLWDVQFRTQTVVQLWAGAVGLGCWGCQGAAQPGMQSETAVAGSGWAREGTAPREPLWGKRSHGGIREMSAGSNLQVYGRKESFSICAFSAVGPAKGNCFCDTRSALAGKVANKSILTGSVCF